MSNVYTAFDGKNYHVWETDLPCETGVLRTPYTPDAYNHKQYTAKKESDRDCQKRMTGLNCNQNQYKK